MANHLPNPHPPVKEKPIPPGGPIVNPGSPEFPTNANSPASTPQPRPAWIKPGQTAPKIGK